MEYKEFYIELGKLVYAIAMADGQVQQEELDTLRNTINTHLAPLEDSMDEFGTDSAFYTEFEFETLMDSQADVKSCFESFMQYIENNKNLFTPKFKAACINVIEEVAKAYQGIIPAEKELIDKIKARLATI